MLLGWRPANPAKAERDTHIQSRPIGGYRKDAKTLSTSGLFHPQLGTCPRCKAPPVTLLAPVGSKSRWHPNYFGPSRHLDWHIPLKAEAAAGFRFGVKVKGIEGGEWTTAKFLNQWCQKNREL